MNDEYDSWRRYEDAKAFKNKLAEIDQLKAEIDMLKNRIEKLEMAARGVPLRDMAALSKALDRVEKLEAVLRVYACEGTCPNCYGAVQDTRYCGWTARKALEINNA